MGAFRWFFLPALTALGRHVKATSRAVTATEVSAWATSGQLDFPVGIAELALADIVRHGYLRAEALPLRSARTRTQRHYFMTPKGMQAAQAALQALPGATPDLQALPTRLWNLLRIRRRLTAAEAAETLIDADDDFEVQTKRIGALFAAWAKLPPCAVKAAHKRENGRIRYVLVADLGRWPPPWRAGQVHPNHFAHVCAVPERYRKVAAE